MSMLIKAYFSQDKSRLAGFFLWPTFRKISVTVICICVVTLCGCEPQSLTVPGELAFRQAQQAQSQGITSRSAELYQQSAQLGYLPAVTARLALQTPTDSAVELRHWLSTLPKAMQPSLLKYYQQLGVKLAQSPTIPEQQVASHCRITVQPMVSTLIELTQWHRLEKDWRHDEFLSSLPVCFLPVRQIDAETIRCSDLPSRRLQCHLPALQTEVKVGHFNQLWVISGRGLANFNNGVLLLPAYADLQLLQHEFSHMLGFLDEYALSTDVANSECVSGRITPNVLFDKADLPQYLRYWQLSEQAVTLTEIATCQRVGLQAYRVVAQASHLQHYELKVPQLYQHLMLKKFERSAEIMPVQYYFAYLARQQGDWPLWLAQMERAAGFGYPEAQAALAEWHSREAASSTAR